MVLSYEDIALEKVSELPTFIGRDEIIPGAQQKYILLLRDPLNFFASRLKRLSTLESHHVDQDSIKSIQRVGLEQIQKLWLSYAREFTGQTNLLGSNMMRINYNSWFEDKAYRDKWLHENFNVRENFDLGKETVLNYGAGSSFDNLAYDGRASKMNTLGRWRDFVNDELFLQLTDNEEIKKFGKNIFDLEGQTLSSMHSKQFIK